MTGVALASVSLASAATNIYITGSSAYRGSTHSAILKLLDSSSDGNTVSVASGATFGFSGGKGLSGANAAIFKGTISGADVIIKCAWSGSVAGVQTVAGNFTVNFPLDTAPTAAGAGSNVAGNVDTTASGAATADLTVPDIAMSDTYQSSTVFNNTFSGRAYESLTDVIVGVVPFKWVASAAAPGVAGTSPTSANLNMTPQLAYSTFVGADRSLSLSIRATTATRP
ncbi:MAG: hypothetical protein WDN28_24770 [Chthoniobacter sp.]